MFQQQNSFEYDELLTRCMGNLEFVQRILTRFESRLADDIEELQIQMSRGDTDEIARVAHRIKGASANTSAPRIQMQAANIEELARAQRLDELPLHLEQLRSESANFSQSISSWHSPTESTSDPADSI